MAELMTAKLEDLDALADQMERATKAIARLKDDNAKLATRIKELEEEVARLKAGG